MNTPQLVSAVIKFALDQHPESKWDTVVTGMRREDIATVITKAEARTPRKAIKAVCTHLDTEAAERTLVLA